MNLPAELTEDLRDASLRVYSWNPRRLELCIAVEDTEHMHRGMICMDEVAHFCLPSDLKVDQMTVNLAGDLPEEFWCSVSIRKQNFAKDKSFFVFDSRDGGRYFVAAKGMKYNRESD